MKGRNREREREKKKGERERVKERRRYEETWKVRGGEMEKKEERDI